jgi:XTP/dITP diphosphohydrolase
MARHFEGGRLVIASHNKNKVYEIADLLAPYGTDVVSAGELNLPEPEETGSTFIDNAILKAEASATGASLPALADDSGLVVHGLDGQPGIYSARWATPDGDFGPAIQKVHDMLEGKEDITAHFMCALALCWPPENGHCHHEVFEGRIDGTIIWPPRGDIGFGYDPIFLPEGRDMTFGETPLEKKHAVSHRARAFANLVAACFA